MVLNDIIEQAAGRSSRLSRVSELAVEPVNMKELIKQKLIEGCFRCIGNLKKDLPVYMND